MAKSSSGTPPSITVPEEELQRSFNQKPCVVDHKTLRQTFDAFDRDGSGAVDFDELEAMVVSMGMTLTPVELYEMLKSADEDDSGEIDFDEFKKLIEDTVGRSAADPESPSSTFARVIERKANSGPPMKWRTDKLGPGLSRIDEDPAVIRRGGGGGAPEVKNGLATGKWGVQLLDTWLSTSQYGQASVLLECDSPSAGFMIGVVGSNYNPTDWAKPLDQEKHAVVVRASDGHVFVKGVRNQCATMCRLPPSGSTSCRIGLDIDMQKLEMRIRCIPIAGGVAVKSASILVENLPVEVAVAVAFGPSDAEQTIRVVGSSCERGARRDRKSNQASEPFGGETVSLESPVKGKAGAGLSEEAAVAATLSQ